MSVKTTGAEWKAFYGDESIWSEGVWHEDEEIAINGDIIDGHEDELATVADEAQMTISGGIVMAEDGKDLGSLESRFKAWRKAQNTETFVVEVAKGQAEALRVVITANGGKVR